MSHFSIYVEFFEAECNRSRPGDVRATIEKLIEVSDDADSLNEKAAFLATECFKIGNLIDFFQASSYLLALRV